MRRTCRKDRGTSLIEVLVVIVIFLIGILAVAQIFPGGFKILRNTNNLTISDALGRGMGEQLSANADQLPDAILPVSNSDVIDPTRFPTDSSLYNEATDTLNQDGTFVDGGVTYSNWAYYSGANVFRKIIGEGVTIPSPRPVGSYYGGLMVLQFGPTRQLSATETTPLLVYGNDFEVQVGAPPVGIIANGQAYIDDPNSAVGAVTITVDDPTVNPTYRFSCTLYSKLGGVVNRHDIVAQVISAPGNGTINGQLFTVPFAQFAPLGESYLSVDPGSVRIQRVFQPLAPLAAFSLTDPYQYKVLNLNMGVLLYNPIGYNYAIQRASGQRENLRGRVDYETRDWRIIGETFHLDDSQTDYKLTMSSIKVLGHNAYGDEIAYQGLGIPAPQADGSVENTDVLFQDVSTGGMILYDAQGSTNPAKNSMLVQQGNGIFKVNSFVQTPNQPPYVWLLLPDPTQPNGWSAPVRVHPNGRTVRVLYEAKGDWTVQPVLASSYYHEANLLPALGAGTYAVGAGNTRIYFPRMDLGNKVSVDQVFYVDSGGNLRTLENQSFVIRDVPADPTGYPYIDLREADASATGFDFSRGYAVRGVRGVSVTVRVWHNEGVFHLDNVSADNISALDTYLSQWRLTSTETYLQRGSN